jgi:hypothetical protein
MLSVPINESNERLGPTRTLAAPEPQRTLHPRYPGACGLDCGLGEGARLAPRSGAAQLRRKVAGLHRTVGNQAVLRMLSRPTPAIQTKLTVNQPGDQYEQEADRVAEQVMRMPASAATPNLHSPLREEIGLQRKCAECHKEEKLQRKCPNCEEEEKLHRRPAAVDGSHSAIAPPIVHEVLNSPGEPLDAPTRAFFEPRFGADFSQVRVHTDTLASESASAVNALAYTVGRDVIFARGRYSPGAGVGRQLLAHELSHVVQQSGAMPDTGATLTRGGKVGVLGQRGNLGGANVLSGNPLDSGMHSNFGERKAGSVLAKGGCSARRVQRTCRDALGAPSPDCDRSDLGVVGWQFKFGVGCDDLLPGEEANMSQLRSGSQLNIHGFASIEGLPEFNMDLSCHRANKIALLVSTLRPDCTVKGTFKHGASPASLPGRIPDPHPRSFWRSVIVEETRPTPQTQAQNSCGPDATDWLVLQIVTAKRNANVLRVRSKLDIAKFFAPRISSTARLDAMEILEGKELQMVGDAWQKARPLASAKVPVDAQGRPRPTADANQQMSELSAVLGLAELATAEAAAPINPDALTTLMALRDAATLWKALVGTKMPYDFKFTTMSDPKSAHCPDSDCSKTITLCPGSSGTNCFEKDLPGNVLFGHVGAFVGFSENALQLGSQWAQLQPNAGSHWDPPEDTNMISFGFNLPTPLTRAAFCSALQGAKSGFATHPCKDCNEPPTDTTIEDPPPKWTP